MNSRSTVPNIFRFWSQIKPHQRIHPADCEVFSRVGRRGHGLDLRCLPGCIGGPLRTAPVVLLFLSPGFAQQDLVDARTSKGRADFGKRRIGGQPFPSDINRPGVQWLISRTKVFGLDFKILRRKFAVLNIGAYHSKNFTDYPLLAALPSSRMSLDWAQRVLFPQAMRGERVVICMRSAHFWGLASGQKYGKSLFAPSVTRGGHMLMKTPEQKQMRDAIVRAVRRAVKSKLAVGMK